ncbi:MAG: hypothetical protein ACF8AM_01625 [Rhodopirellula sp. JB055]|uniref:hypothetical protein n=1 Tax=Rhodopirellula sp. JB055 TaxID=3342846 RepID=UPI00370BE874
MTTDTTASDFASSPDSISVRFSSGVTLAIVGTFLFAMKSIFIKLAFAAGADATLLLTIRMVLAFPLYVGVFATLLWRRQSGGVDSGLPAFTLPIVIRSW